MHFQKMSLRFIFAGSVLAGFALGGIPGCTVTPARVEYVEPVYVAPPPPRPVVVYQRPVYQPQPTVVQRAPAPDETSVPDAQQAPADSQIETLVAPIALYPDPLLAVVLPASTYPQQVEEAGSWLAANPSPSPEAIDAQPWEPSVKALVRYPDALQTLDKDPQWTESLGAAYNANPKEVSNAIQELRSRAIAANNLQTNAQVAVVQEDNVIAIQPAQPTVIYVPRYDPVVVYTTSYPIVYTSYYPVGPWLVNGYDWGGGVIFVGDWRGPYYWHDGYWGYHHGWYGHYSYWHRDGRWGPPYRGRYYAPRAFHGREPEFHRAMARENTYRGGGRSVAQMHTYQRERVQQVQHQQQHPGGPGQHSGPQGQYSQQPHPQQQHPQQQHPQQHQGGGGSKDKDKR